VAKREETKAAHILVLGDKKAGKRTLVEALNKPLTKQMGLKINLFEDIGSDFSLFESSFMYMRDIADYEETGTQNVGYDDSNLILVNVWLISDEEMAAMIPKILKPEDLEFTMAIIMPEID
jgi:hypothetical protein